MIGHKNFCSPPVPAAMTSAVERTNSGEGGVSYQGQATRITGLLRDLGKDWPQITHVILYVDLDRPNIGASNPHEAYFGLWENTSNWVRTPKPAVEAIKNLYRA
jgi:hypothetical protein